MSTRDLSSSTVRPARHKSLAEKSFFGKLATLTDDYATLPADVTEEDACAECDECPDDSILNLPEPQTDLARLAEHTRSSLMMKRPGSTSHVTFAAESESVDVCDEEEDSMPAATPAAACKPKPKSSSSGRPAVRGSMMTHPPSRVTPLAVAGKGPAAVGHTFGGLPRTSPSGTMAHHASMVPTPAATAALQRPRSARARLGGGASDSDGGSVSSSRPSTADGGACTGGSSRPSTGGSSRPSTARSERSSDSSGAPATSKFAADAKGGVLAWRKPEDGTKPRVATKPPSRQEIVRQQKAADDADAAVKKGAPFAFAVMCCGDEYEGFCCKRHHPDDTVVCCSVHAPIRLRVASTTCSMVKVKSDSIAERYKALMKETAASSANTRWRA